MSIVTRIKEFFGKRAIIGREQLDRLRSLPQDRSRSELGRILYEHCVQRTTAFVSRELMRGDSPYAGVDRPLFFHEMLAVTFWLLDRDGCNGKGDLLKELHRLYFSNYPSSDGEAEGLKRLSRKYEGYEDTWNEITGHLDEFGLHVVQNIFGKEASDRTRERSFWIIQYADEAAEAFLDLKKSLTRLRLSPMKQVNT